MTVTVLTPPAEFLHARRPAPATPQALADAPVTEHRLAEAVLAWQHLRPRPDPDAPVPPYVPIACTGDELVATRMVRVLTGLTWAVVVGDREQYWVGVPRHDYHRVGRALVGTWRRYRQDFTAMPAVPVDPAAAIALWRMALLLRGGMAAGHGFQLRIAAPSGADVLCRAARVLGVPAMIDPSPRGRRTVMVSRPADVRRLFALTT